jgi:hypothetical protein
MHAMTWKHLRPFPPLPVAAFVLTVSATLQAADTTKPVKVFILAGDANCLEQGAVSGRTDGKDGVFFPNGNPVKDEVGRHVNGAVYQGASKAGTHYDILTPEWTGEAFVVAFSCKGRGVCPSCNGRHMAQTAAHLVDHVIPPVPVRQWVISVPKRLRGMLADRPAAVAMDSPANGTSATMSIGI